MTSLFNRLYENYNLGHYNKVVSIAEAVIQNHLASSDASKIQAASYFKLGNFQKSYDILCEIESLYDSDPDYLSLYAACCRRLGHLEKSSQIFRLALSIKPDSISIKNNYANLLIDLGEYDAAGLLLDEILIDNPTYEDALKNKNRLNFLLSEQSTSKPNEPSLQSNIDLPGLGDPLLLAFADDEIERSSKRYKFKRDESSPKLDLPAPDSNSTVQDFLKMAYQASTSGDYRFALKLCSQSLHQIGPQGLIYECASDLYLKLKNFRLSEMCLLISMSLDGPFKTTLNLLPLHQCVVILSLQQNT